MLSIIVVSIICGALFTYLFYLYLFISGIKSKKHEINNTKQTVSVVIAARNEEKTLPKLLTALVNQSYPETLYEVIVANDGSTDKTMEIVEEFSAKWPFIKFVNVRGRDGVVSPKKNALTQAIALAKNEIILSTDADCFVGKYWIEAIVKEYDNDKIAMVCGFSKTRPGKWESASLVKKFEHFDFIAIFSAAAGAMGSGKYFSCSGQNISYRKNDFNDVGGFSKIWHLISGDDVNLMQLFRKDGKEIKFCQNYHSFVSTRAVDSWQELLNQRSRWASNMKWQIKLNPEFFSYLISAFLLTVATFGLFFIEWWLPLIIIGLRVVFEYYFLKQSFQAFKIEKRMLKFYPIWFIIQPFYMISISVLGALNIFSWKK